MPKIKNNLKIYAYKRKNRLNNEKSYDKINSNNSTLIEPKDMNNKSFQKLNSNKIFYLNSMNQSITSKKSYKNDNSCYIIL